MNVSFCIAFIFLLNTLIYIGPSQAFELDLKSVRTTLSIPKTSHTLIFDDVTPSNQKTLFSLAPLHNERIGVYFDINGIEIGYAIDAFDQSTETKTQDLLFSYRKFKHSKITFNYQTLEGLQKSARELNSGQTAQLFGTMTKSTKIELFGQHNLYTFGNKSSLFQHFFLNKPQLSHEYDWSLSLVGGWSFKHLTLENQESIVFQAEFLQSQTPEVTKLTSNSIGVNIGPFVSFHLPYNIHGFSEYKIGKGHIRNEDPLLGLKDSGDEKVEAIGAGLSWTSNNKKLLVVLRAWQQKGRHIDTSFGDLSLIKFF
ncbi:hypothetical protein [Paraglaciecola sp. 2405UD69-4]|uniref:hypothetical protein n=1 Tax=Paraglaciecola sp. 2405UD69-4 TaxID=3391836 RepID=UPI0039C9AF3A